MIFDPEKMRSTRERAEMQLKRIEAAHFYKGDPGQNADARGSCRLILAHMRFAEETYRDMLAQAKALADEILP